MITGIYYILNTHNNKMYIGKSDNVVIRLQSHRSALHTNRHKSQTLQDEWNQFGEHAFEMALLTEHSESWPLRTLIALGNIYELERFFIRLYQTSDPRFGYNCNHREKAIASAQYRKPMGPIKPTDSRLRANRTHRH